MFQLVYTVLFPPTCVLCDSITDNSLDICYDCFSELPHNHICCTRCALPLPPGNSTTGLCGSCLNSQKLICDSLVPFQYQPPADFMVQRLKFNSELKFGRLIGELLANAAANRQRPDLLVPVPQHSDRLLQRGFNHAAQIAQITGARLSINVDYSLVEKVTATPPQAGLNARQRKTNQQNAFRINRPVESLHIAIVDDVITTGATSNALAKALRQAGCRKISVWAFARTP